MPYRIEYKPIAKAHAAELSAAERSLLAKEIPLQLTHEAETVTRNRKQLQDNPVARWSLRVQDLRVYYDVEKEPEPSVLIVAIGKKDRARVWIGGQDFSAILRGKEPMP